MENRGSVIVSQAASASGLGRSRKGFGEKSSSRKIPLIQVSQVEMENLSNTGDKAEVFLRTDASLVRSPRYRGSKSKSAQERVTLEMMETTKADSQFLCAFGGILSTSSELLTSR